MTGGSGWAQRLGVLPAAVRALRQPIWVHAASVGEVLSAEPLVHRLKADYPSQSVLLTTTSLTGRRTAQQRGGADGVTLLPLDLPPIVGATMRQL
ncbi:MAG TPA: glycosyltransferase N-terminal domain-containing protein, partial [Terriglobales bacterium]|nr:glycosyltransferase N-terminal domain-containing protein [Terriglobales bacterium]